LAGEKGLEEFEAFFFADLNFKLKDEFERAPPTREPSTRAILSLCPVYLSFRAGGYRTEMMVTNLVFAFLLLPNEPLLPSAQCRCAVLASSFGALPFRPFAPTQQRLGPFLSSSSSGDLTLSLRNSKIN
jgi:hypothetical protein